MNKIKIKIGESGQLSTVTLSKILIDCLKVSREQALIEAQKLQRGDEITIDAEYFMDVLEAVYTKFGRSIIAVYDDEQESFTNEQKDEVWIRMNNEGISNFILLSDQEGKGYSIFNKNKKTIFIIENDSLHKSIVEDLLRRNTPIQ